MKLLFATVGVINVGAYCAYVFPHTRGLEMYRKMRARYDINQKELPLNKTLQKRFDKVKDDLKLSETDREKIKAFNVFGYNMFHAGLVIGKKYGLVGIPMYFEHKDVHSAQTNTPTLCEVYIDWSKSAAKKFLQSIVLSESAQKYAMAREILKLQTNAPIWTIVILGIHTTTSYGIYKFLDNKLVNRSKSYRSFCLSTFVSLYIYMWFAITDWMNCKFDSEIDQQLCELGPEYIKGGKEFYEKLLSRNTALRVLLGDEGKELFTVTGNERSLIRQKSIPIYDRKTFFESKLPNNHSLF